MPVLFLLWLGEVQYKVMFGLALGNGIHAGHAHELVFFAIKFNWSVFGFGRNAGEAGLPFRAGINTHIELVKSSKAVGYVDADESCRNGLAGGIDDVKIDCARSGASIHYKGVGIRASLGWRGGRRLR